jgi:tRNA(Ile)-lysidine synthase
LLGRIARTVRGRCLLDADARVLVALSGGADSVALLLGLHALEPDAPWTLTGVVHVHHGLRAADADEDEQFCRDLAARLDLPIHVEHVDVAAQASAAGQSLETAARHLRYGVFEQVAARSGATAVATGHTQDDQAETVLLRLLRGASARGLSGIRPRRGLYVRPLLDASRTRIRAFLAARGEAFREDRSNADPAIPRNRLRHTLLPQLAAEWPGSLAALARAADLATDDEIFLSRTAAEVAPALSLSDGAGVQLDVRGLVTMPAALARRIVRDAIEAAGGTPAHADIEAVRRLASSARPDRRLNLRRVDVFRRGPVLSFERPTDRRSSSPVRPFDRPLPVPGSVDIPEIGSRVEAALTPDPPVDPRLGVTTAVLQAASLALPLRVRSRRPGDRLRPLGAPGTRKLQDILVDRRVPRGERDAVALVVDARGEIVWVVGHVIADACRVTAPLSDVVVLKMKDFR